MKLQISVITVIEHKAFWYSSLFCIVWANSLIGTTDIKNWLIGGLLILYYEFKNEWQQMLAIIILYVILAVFAWVYSKKVRKNEKNS